MQFLTMTAFLAATVLAMPGHGYPSNPNTPAPGTGTDVSPPPPNGGNGGNPGTPGTTGNTVNGDQCAPNTQISCCQNQITDNSVDNSSGGAIAALVGLLSGPTDILTSGIGSYSGCGALTGLLGQCNANTVCCNPDDVNQVGLVNVAIPCLPVNVL